VVVARVTLAAPPPPSAGVLAEAVQDPKTLARRSDLHAARRLRRRDGLLGLGVLAVTFGATVTVLDVFH